MDRTVTNFNSGLISGAAVLSGFWIWTIYRGAVALMWQPLFRCNNFLRATWCPPEPMKTPWQLFVPNIYSGFRSAVPQSSPHMPYQAGWFLRNLQLTSFLCIPYGRIQHLEEKPTEGFEPTAARLQVGCASNCATLANGKIYQFCSFFLIFSSFLFFSLRWRSRTRGRYWSHFWQYPLCSAPLPFSHFPAQI